VQLLLWSSNLGLDQRNLEPAEDQFDLILPAAVKRSKSDAAAVSARGAALLADGVEIRRVVLADAQHAGTKVPVAVEQPHMGRIRTGAASFGVQMTVLKPAAHISPLHIGADPGIVLHAPPQVGVVKFAGSNGIGAASFGPGAPKLTLGASWSQSSQEVHIRTDP